MKVALLTTEYPPRWGGMGSNVFHTARELARRGHEVHVVTRLGPAPPPLANVTVHRVGMAPVPVHYAVSFARRAVPVALALDADVVHVHSPCALPTRRAWDAMDAAGVGTVVTFHGTWRGERAALALDGARRLTLNDLGILALSGAHERLETLALRRARMPVTVSGFSKGELAAYDAREAARVRVVPNGVDVERFAPRGPPPGDGTVLAVGRLSGRKNLLALVRAAARPESRASRLVPVALEVVADAPEHDLLDAYAGADVFALPSRYEGQGIAFLEAMAGGLPVVAGRAGGAPEVVVDGVTGALVAPDDERALAAAIGRYLADPALARAHGEAGRRRAEEFAWPRLVEDLLALYKEALP